MPASTRPCPVCGGELGWAPDVECPCGRWMHLERPDRPGDKDSLNCYLEADECGECRRRTSLDPQFVPEVPEKLTSQSSDGNEWDDEWK